MEILAISYGAVAFFLLVAMLSKFGKTIDDKERRIGNIKGKNSKQESFEELNDSFFRRFIQPTIKQIQAQIQKINAQQNKGNKKKDTTKIVERQLRLAGMDISAEGYMFYKNVFMALVIVVCVFAGLILNVAGIIKLLIVAGGAAVALLGPNMYLKTMAKARQEAIRIQVPDALDLLGVCIEAGLSFDSSLLKVSEKIDGPFIDELLMVYREMQMGIPRAEALKSLSDATEIPELKTFVAALAQANQLGIPINNVMDVQSKQLRATRKQLAQEKGMKAPIKMMIPMVVLIFPVLFIILMGPAVLNIMDTL